MASKPLIAVILDENTSVDSLKYEASKRYFDAVARAGGIPFGVPYLPEIVEATFERFDGLVSVGGRFSYPDDWYVFDQKSHAPQSDRFEIERSLVQGFLDRDKPVLGICAGMQMLACLQGCQLSPDVQQLVANPLEHDRKGASHAVQVSSGSKLYDILGTSTLEVNSFHREAIATLVPSVIASAHAPDGVIEAIEVPSQKFALGIQWHQELLEPTHPGALIFEGLIRACRPHT
mgnify:CR=1 FL=1